MVCITRTGADGEAVQPEKGSGVENCLKTRRVPSVRCGDCAQIIDCGVVCAARPDGQIRRAGSHRTEDAEICLPSGEGQSSPTANGCTICTGSLGCLGVGQGTDQHSLGLKETDPFATLVSKTRKALS